MRPLLFAIRNMYLNAVCLCTYKVLLQLALCKIHLTGLGLVLYAQGISQELRDLGKVSSKEFFF